MTTNQGRARLEILRTKAEIEALRTFWTSYCTHRDAEFDFFQFIVELFPDAVRPHVIVLYSGEMPKALVVARLEQRPLHVKFGYWRISTPRVRVLTFVRGCVVGDLSNEDAELIIKKIIGSLADGEADLARFEALDPQSPLYAQAVAAPGFFYSDHFATFTVHYKREIIRSGKSFIDCLSSNARQNHRRRTKQILATLPGAVRIERFDDISGIDRLIRDSDLVARNAYQRGLGVGLVDSTQTRQRLEYEAKRGWLRGHVLYVKDEPCAFLIGTLYRGTWYGESTGFDPKYTKFGFGIHLMIHALGEITDVDGKDAASNLDFGPGESWYKTSLGNVNYQEASLHIFAPTLKGLCLNAFWSFAAAINRTAEALLAKTNLVPRIKRMWRKIAIGSRVTK